MLPQGSSGFDVFMCRQVIADDKRARLDFGDQNLADIGGERFAIHGPLNNPRSNKLIVGKTCNECLRAPSTEGCAGSQPGAASGSPAQSGHVGFDTGLVNEDNAMRFCGNGWQAPAEPVSAGCLHMGLASFIRDEALFLSLIPQLGCVPEPFWSGFSRLGCTF